MINIKKIAIFLNSIGISPQKFILSIKGIPIFLKHLFYAIKENRGHWKISLFPILADRFDQSGIAKGHYFHQDLWAAKRIYSESPKTHIDVGSRVDGFIAHLLTFRDVTVIDVRDLKSKVSGLHFLQANMMGDVSALNIKSESISCLHAIEHFGLGRYGDPFSWNGWELGITNIVSLLLPGGILYLSVPIGRERVEFNAHRVFSPMTIISFSSKLGLSLKDFSYIDDLGDFHSSVSPLDAVHCDYGCGCFEFHLNEHINQLKL